MKNTTELKVIEIGILRQLAFMQHEGEDYFILDGIAYEGKKEDKMFESNEDGNCQDFPKWCEDNCTQVEEFSNDDYMILTDAEADEKAKEYIKDSLWAFNAEFIIGECGLDYSGADSLRKMQSDSCEGANDFILSLVEKCTDLDSFVESAISADGRGHFLSSYDGNENEETVDLSDTNCTDEIGKDKFDFFIYRTN